MIRYVCFGILLVLATAVAAFPRLALWLSGYRPLQPLDVSSVDNLSQVESSGATEFFKQRNTLEVEVPRDMNAGEFLQLYQLESFSHVREELASQLGVDSLRDETPLKKGGRFIITLTPPEDGVP
jgi:hypothetical protein